MHSPVPPPLPGQPRYCTLPLPLKGFLPFCSSLFPPSLYSGNYWLEMSTSIIELLNGGSPLQARVDGRKWCYRTGLPDDSREGWIDLCHSLQTSYPTPLSAPHFLILKFTRKSGLWGFLPFDALLGLLMERGWKKKRGRGISTPLPFQQKLSSRFWVPVPIRHSYFLSSKFQ